MKISITLAVIGVVVAEFVAAQRGIGYLIVMANGLLDTPLMMAAIIALSVMGLALYGAIALVERTVIYWHPTSDVPRGGFA
jgi:NitT/TauT family transport system permease protein